MNVRNADYEKAALEKCLLCNDTEPAGGGKCEILRECGGGGADLYEQCSVISFVRRSRLWIIQNYSE